MKNPKTKKVTAFTPERCCHRQRVLAKRPVKWSANRIEPKAKVIEIANEVREKIIDLIIIASTAKREEQTA